ncbi:CGNR zinc finger domain-containing protein [Planomonospora corallina]|uniref:CGNR zinc finger domain-containing protein n=1 Tax=Planomonospora corallina TaxID=1806052 RepID=A0ABV8I7P6_9ACTN
MTEPAALVCDFVNSYDVESGADALPSSQALVAWLARRGLAGADDTAGDEELAVAVGLRESLRAALRTNHPPSSVGGSAGEAENGPAGSPPETAGEPGSGPPGSPRGTAGERGNGPAGGGPLGDDPGRTACGEPGGASENPLPRVLDRLPVTVVLTAEGPVLEPVTSGVLGGLARIAAAVVEVRVAGLWPRMKVCTESTCQWAFVDSSKNRSRSWCSMKVCGNRTKTRAYRARRQSGTG